MCRNISATETVPLGCIEFDNPFSFFLSFFFFFVPRPAHVRVLLISRDKPRYNRVEDRYDRFAPISAGVYRVPSDPYHLLNGSFATYPPLLLLLLPLLVASSPTSHFKLLIRRTTIYLGQCSDRQTLLRLVIESWSVATCCCPPSVPVSLPLLFSRA